MNMLLVLTPIDSAMQGLLSGTVLTLIAVAIARTVLGGGSSSVGRSDPADLASEALPGRRVVFSLVEGLVFFLCVWLPAVELGCVWLGAKLVVGVVLWRDHAAESGRFDEESSEDVLADRRAVRAQLTHEFCVITVGNLFAGLAGGAVARLALLG